MTIAETTITMIGYIIFTVAVTEWRTKFRRGMNTRDNAIRQRATDSMLNAETVKLYTGEGFEAAGFRGKVKDYQQYEWASLASLTPEILDVLKNVDALSINQDSLGTSTAMQHVC